MWALNVYVDCAFMHSSLQVKKVVASERTTRVTEKDDTRRRILTHDVKSTKSRCETRHLFTTRHVYPRQITVGVLQTHVQYH